MARYVEGNFTIDGKPQKIAYSFPNLECNECLGTETDTVWFERSVKGNKYYPLSLQAHVNSSRGDDSSCIERRSLSDLNSLSDQIKDLEDKTKVSKNDECQTQEEKVLSDQKKISSAFWSHFETFAERKSNTSKADIDMDDCSSIVSIIASESSDDVTILNEDNEELVQRNRKRGMSVSSDEVTTIEQENEKLMKKSGLRVLEQSLISSSEASRDSSVNCEEVLPILLKSYETDQGNSHLYECDTSLDDSDSNSSSSLRQGETTNQNESHDKKGEFEDKKSKKRPQIYSERQSPKMQKNSISKEEASVLNTSTEFCQHTIGKSQSSVESENSDVFKTAYETLSQASETLEGYSSGSATP